ncbi:hypothetical protein [Vibrio vulnificus]|uniref:hypothetical protein n=1 Tax=Vibrio vulnificus TaxID=672 RepID=UPI00324279C1
MNISILSKLSLLEEVLSRPYRAQLRGIIDSTFPSRDEYHKEQLLNVYAAFLFSLNKKNFTGIDIFNDKNKFQDHVSQLIGFIYHEASSGLGTKYTLAHALQKLMCGFAKASHINISSQVIGHHKINDYMQSCIASYRSLQVDAKKINYLDGWSITSQERKDIFINLDFFYVKYDQTLSAKIYDALTRFGLTQKTNTLKHSLYQILSLLEGVSSLDLKGTVESYELLLSEKNVQSTFYKVYRIKLSQCLVMQNDLANFNRSFVNTLDIYTSVFINTKIYQAPLKPFVKPSILKDINPPSFSAGGKLSDLDKIRWFSDIPLQIRDDEAVNLIESRVNRDMSYLKAVLINHFNELKNRQERNEEFIEAGKVKPLSGNKGGKKGMSQGGAAYDIGMNHLDNVIATFYSYGIGGYEGHSYTAFLGFKGKLKELLKELNLPSSSTLFGLTALLVIEHPKITPSWLQKLQLFNENGKLTGYIQVNNQYVLTSEKDRRGPALAQQDVILNDFSISIVDFIVKHTEPAREYLKAVGNPDWKYLLLICPSLYKAERPTAYTHLYKPLPIVQVLLNDEAYMPSEHDLSSNELGLIANITTHRAIRRHRGLQIYLKTRSQSAVAEALGHKKTESRLLDSYLPKPLMDFFTERVIRQFQNAIILKAMEKSRYLQDAVNMTYEEIEEFLENHGLNDIPDLNTEAFDAAASKVEQSFFDSVVFTVTVPLLQLLISIKTIIDTDNDESEVTELVKHWYQSASYLLQRFEMGDFGDNDDIEDMYREAKETPLNHDIIKGVVLC